MYLLPCNCLASISCLRKLRAGHRSTTLSVQEIELVAGSFAMRTPTTDLEEIWLPEGSCKANNKDAVQYATTRRTRRGELQYTQFYNLGLRRRENLGLSSFFMACPLYPTARRFPAYIPSACLTLLMVGRLGLSLQTSLTSRVRLLV